MEKIIEIIVTWRDGLSSDAVFSYILAVIYIAGIGLMFILNSMEKKK